MKRVVIISLYALDTIGGTERAAVNLANLLCGDYEVKILSCSISSTPSFYEIDARVTYSSLGLPEIPDSLWAKMTWYYKFICRLRNYVTANGVDCLIGTAHGVNSMLPFVSFAHRVKTIGCEHFVYEEIVGIYAKLRRIMYPLLDSVVVLTHQAATHYLGHKCLKVIPNYMELFHSVNQPVTANHSIILAIGRYDEGKDFTELINIAAILKSRNIAAKFRLVGDGELKPQFVSLIKELKVEEYVTLVPPTREIEKEYLAASIYAMTSRAEALPMVLLEAKKYGLPIVSYACPEGPLSLVNSNVDGFLVTNRERQEFADRLQELLSNENLRHQQAEASRASLAPFAKARIAQQWADLLTKLLQNGRTES